MKRRGVKIENLEEKMSKRKSYKDAIRVVDGFFQEQDKSRESLVIHPYAEFPWQTSISSFSS